MRTLEMGLRRPVRPTTIGRCGPVVAIITMILSLAPGCALRDTNEGGQPGTGARPLRLGVIDNLRSLSPLQNDGFDAGMLNSLVFSYLERTASDGSLVPELVRAVPTRRNGGISPDGRTITYRLRDDVRWQDGTPLTAADVVFTVRAILNPRNNVGSRDPYVRLRDVAAPDAHTVVVRLRERDAAIVDLFFTPDSNYAILPAHLLANEPELNDVAFNAKPIGSGPYRVAAWDRGSVVHLVANPTYFRGKPRIAKIDLRYLSDTTTALVQLKTGELDALLGGDVGLGSQYAALPRYRMSNVPYTGASIAAFNTERGVFADRRIRRAIARGIDRVRLVADVTRGFATAHDASRGLFSYADDPHAPWPTYDPGAAAADLDRAGWRLGPGGVRQRNGRLLALDLIFPTSSASNRIEAVEMQQQLARLGVRVDLHGYTYTQFWSHAEDGGPFVLGKFDLALARYSSNVDPDVSWLFACRERAPRGYNDARYCNPHVDAALRDSAHALDDKARRAELARVQRLVANDVPLLPLYQSRELDVIPRNVDGFVANGTLPYDSVEHWRIRPSR